LCSIVQTGTLKDDERDALVGRAKAFYFSRLTGENLTWEGYLTYLAASGGPDPTPTPSTTAEAPGTAKPELDSTKDVLQGTNSTVEEKTLSFSQIQELIASGRVDEIPFNRRIPEEISPEEPSRPLEALRKKPWEVEREA